MQIETVSARDGKLEDKLVFGSIALILGSAALLLLVLYPTQEPDFESVPKPLLYLLTTLSNAGEELQITREIEGRIPNLTELIQNGVTPFSREQLDSSPYLDWKQLDTCFLARIKINNVAYQIRLILPETNILDSPKAEWRILNNENTSHSESIAKACATYSDGWLNSTILGQPHSHKAHHDHPH